MRRTFTMAEAARYATEYQPTSIPDLAELRGTVGSYGAVEVPDPIGRDAAAFRAMGSQLAEMIPPILELCRRLKTDGD